MNISSNRSENNSPATAAKNRLADIETLEDRQQIHINHDAAQNTCSYVSWGVKPANLFTMAFMAFFRSDTRKQLNRTTIDKVAEDIGAVHGDQAAAAFNQAMSSKRASGSPLTKGALMRFFDAHHAAVTDVIANKVADAIEDAIKQTLYAPNTETYYDKHTYSFTNDKAQAVKANFKPNSYLSPLETPLRDIGFKDNIDDFLKKISGDNEATLPLFLDSTPRTQRIKILKKVLSPPTQDYNDSDQE